MKPFDQFGQSARIAALTFLIGLTSVGQAQYTVESAQGATEIPMGRGLFYYLPQNGIELQITVEKTTYKKGIYGDYAASTTTSKRTKASIKSSRPNCAIPCSPTRNSNTASTPTVPTSSLP